MKSSSGLLPPSAPIFWLQRRMYIPWYKEVHVIHATKMLHVCWELNWQYHSAQVGNVEPGHVSLCAPGAQLSSSLTCVEMGQKAYWTLEQLKGVPQNPSTHVYLLMEKSLHREETSCLNSNFIPNFKGFWDLLRKAQQALRASLYASKHYYS